MMRNLFDLSPGDLPGLDTFFAYIEHKFASPALQGGPFGVSDIWAWSSRLTILNTLRSSHRNQPTFGQLLSDPGLLASSDTGIIYAQAIFASLCVITGVAKPTTPKRPPPDNAPLPLNDFRLAVEHGGKKWGLLTRFTEPVLVQFSMIHDYYTRATPGYQLFEEDEPAELYKPRLGYDCLAKLGGVTLRFVDCIIDHLKFDRPSRTLSIYRFPSLYLAHLRRTRKKSALAYSMLFSIS